MPYATPGADIVPIIDAAPTPIDLPGARRAVPGAAAPRVASPHRHAGPALPGAGRAQAGPGARRPAADAAPDRPVGAAARRRDRDARWTCRPGRRSAPPIWAPDGRRFAFTVDRADGIGVWTADAATGDVRPGARADRSATCWAGTRPATGGTVRWSRDGRSLLVLAAPGRAAGAAGAADRAADRRDRRQAVADGHLHRPAEHPGRRGHLRGAGDDRAAAGSTRSPASASSWGRPGCTSASPSPPTGPTCSSTGCSGRSRSASRGSTSPGGPRCGLRPATLVAVIADLPVSDEVPRKGVPTGPRLVSWEERAPASLVWAEALDGGDPVTPAEHRDGIFRLGRAVHRRAASASSRLAHRCLGWYDLDEPHQLLLAEHDRDRRWLTTWLLDLAEPDEARVIFDLSMDDAYGDPGTPLMALRPDGTRTVLRRRLRHLPARRRRHPGRGPAVPRPLRSRHADGHPAAREPAGMRMSMCSASPTPASPRS